MCGVLRRVLRLQVLRSLWYFIMATPPKDAGVPSDENSPKDSFSEPIPVNKAPDTDKGTGVPSDGNSPKDGLSESIPVNKDTDEDAAKPNVNIPKKSSSGPINKSPDTVEDSDDDTAPHKKWKPFRKLDFDNMPLEEKRSYYKCGKHFITLDSVVTWPDYVKANQYSFFRKGLLRRNAVFSTDNDMINKKVSLWQGDITCLEIDAIVNAANESLRGGGGVDGCIHRAAGGDLLQECIKLNECETGNAKMTSGYRLPAKKVIHTVGPIGEKKYELQSCYESCLKIVKEHNLRTIAFCCISTGIYGYPNRKAADVALQTVKEWLENNEDTVDRIIFCVFLPKDVDIYRKLMLKYFPCTVAEEDPKDEKTDDSKVKAADDPPKIASKDENPKISDDSKTEDDVKDDNKGTGENTGQDDEKGNEEVLVTASDASGGLLEHGTPTSREGNVEKVEDVVSSKETSADIEEKDVDFGVEKDKDVSKVESLEVEEEMEEPKDLEDNSSMPADENDSNTKGDQEAKKRKREEDDEVEMDVDNKATEVENKMVMEVDSESPDSETSVKDEK